MSYSIIRMQKMKSTAIKGIQFHNQREKESETNPDINKADSHLNYDLINGQRQIDYTDKINQVIEDNVTSGKKIRKDAVRLAEFLITSDKEFFEKISPKEQKRYFETAHEFLADRYGEKNLIYATVHHDEKTPHMHVGFVPVTEDGRLSAKDFFGQKKQLVSLQDDFNDYLKQNDFDLERGVSSSRKHVETAKYKAMTFQNM
ncbi:MobV family relaxase, partial [Cytobacillus pseudoceanisediminis]